MKFNAKKSVSVLAALVLMTGVGISGKVAAQPVPGACGPMDLVFVVDDTGSMFGAIANIQAGLVTIIGDANTASGGDLQLALTTFKDLPTTVEDLPSPEGDVTTSIGALSPGGGAGAPEASDVALDAVVNGLGFDGDGVTCGDAFSAGNWRAGAVKIAIMLTDNPPGGCNDLYTGGTDDVNADRVANDAAAGGILISAIYNSDAPDPTTEAIMMNYASTTGGQYVNTPFNGDGTAAAISDIITDCGSSSNECPNSQGYWKNHPEDWSLIELEIGGTTYSADELLEILWTPPKKGNSNLILAHQLIAAYLNIANGSNSSVIADELADAQAYLAGEDLPGDFQKNKDMNALAGVLDDYNNRYLTPDCEEGSGDQ